MIKSAQTFAVTVLATASLLACSQESSGPKPSAATPSGDVVAKVGDLLITADELQAKMEENSPFLRAKYDTAERKREFLDNHIRFELLAQEAVRRGLDKDPDVQTAMKKTMVQKLMKEQFDSKPTVDEGEIRAFYDQNINDYVKPERVRSSHIFFEAAKGDANRAKVKAEATKALATVKAKPGDRNVFSDLAKTRSDDNFSKRAGGDLSYKTSEQLEESWGTELANAIFALKETDEIGGLVETEKGFHIIKFTGRQAAMDRSFESVKQQIESRLANQARTKAFDVYVEELKEKAAVSVNEEALAKIEVKGGGVPGPTGGSIPTIGGGTGRTVPAKAPAAKTEKE